MNMESLEFRSAATFIQTNIGDEAMASLVFAAADKIDELANKLDAIKTLLGTEFNGYIYWEWIEEGLGGPFAENLRSILNDGSN